MTRSCVTTKTYTNAHLERISRILTERICISYTSPYLQEEVYDAALVAAHLAREENVIKSMLWLRIRRSAVRELYTLIGYRSGSGKKAREAGFKAPVLSADTLTLMVDGKEIDHPGLPLQCSQYDSVENSDFAYYLLSLLSEKRRGMIMARYLDGLSDVEIAKIYGVSPKSTARTIKQSLGMLRALPEVQDLFFSCSH